MNDRASTPITAVYADADADAGDRVSRALGAHESITATAVSTAADALDRLDAAGSPVDCVVSARALRDSTGLELLDAVRERDPHLPFVLYPGDGDERLASEAIAAGVTDYLPRDLDDDARGVLAERVRDAVREYRRCEETRRESDMFGTLMEEVPLSIYFKDREARHVRVSQEVGPTMSTDAIGKTDVELYADELNDQAVQSYRDDLEVIETGDPIIDKEEAWLINVDDAETIWLRTTKIPWRDDDGEIQGLVGVTRDVTELKKRERELRRQKHRLDRFASFASHDLRNPLNIAQGYLDRAIETGDESALREAASALDRMDALIDDLLATARSEVGVPTVEPVELPELIERLWAETAVDEATLRVEVPDGTLVRADPGQLRHLLVNLFKNAITHAGPDVEVVVGLTETGFYVEDDGPGIPESERDPVLEYGYTTADGGTGMGLAIVTQVADAHDWSLTIDDGAAGGARFEVTNCLTIPRPEAVPSVEREGRRVELADGIDIGGATPRGTTRRVAAADEWVVRGGGRNVWQQTDECHFAAARANGPARIVARLADLRPVHEYSKAGLMIRADPEAGSPLGFVGVQQGDEPEVIWRSDPDRAIVSRQLLEDGSPPIWLRLDRVGSRVTCFRSDDGEAWTQVDQREIRCGDAASLGLAVCSHDPSQRATAVFDHVSVVEL